MGVTVIARIMVCRCWDSSVHGCRWLWFRPFRGGLLLRFLSSVRVLAPFGNGHLVLFAFFLFFFNVRAFFRVGCIPPHFSQQPGHFGILHFRMLLLEQGSFSLRKVQKGRHGPFGSTGIFLGAFPRYLPGTRVGCLFYHVSFLVFGGNIIPVRTVFSRQAFPKTSCRDTHKDEDMAGTIMGDTLRSSTMFWKNAASDLPHFGRALGDFRDGSLITKGFLDFRLFGHEKANIAGFEPFGCLWRFP